MREAPPLREQTYTAVVVLGGSATGNRLRVRYGAEILGVSSRTALHARAHSPLLLGIGSARPLGEEERRDAGTDVEREHDHLRGELDRLISDRGTGGCGTHTGERAHRHGDLDGTCVLSVEAGSRVPGRRADTLDCVLAGVEVAGAGGRKLVVTSAIYIPYTTLLLASGLPHHTIEVTGTPMTAPPSLRQSQLIGQEIHASILTAARALRAHPPPRS